MRRAIPQPARTGASILLREQDVRHLARIAGTGHRAASCAAVAGCLIPIFAGNAYRTIVPLFFLLVILYVALRFGHVAGIVGTLVAALVFEIFLFEPTLSLAIKNSSARNHLISMVILGVCASELLGRRKASEVYKSW